MQDKFPKFNWIKSISTSKFHYLYPHVNEGKTLLAPELNKTRGSKGWTCLTANATCTQTPQQALSLRALKHKYPHVPGTTLSWSPLYPSAPIHIWSLSCIWPQSTRKPLWDRVRLPAPLATRCPLSHTCCRRMSQKLKLGRRKLRIYS